MDHERQKMQWEQRVSSFGGGYGAGQNNGIPENAVPIAGLSQMQQDISMSGGSVFNSTFALRMSFSKIFIFLLY